MFDKKLYADISQMYDYYQLSRRAVFFRFQKGLGGDW